MNEIAKVETTNTSTKRKSRQNNYINPKNKPNQTKAFNPYKKRNPTIQKREIENNQSLHTFELYKPFTPENNIYTYIKQNTGFNSIKFWELLNIVLENKKFEDIKTERLSLISYVVIYDKENIYNDLLDNYFDKITQEEVEKSLFPLSLNKNPIFIIKNIEKYNEKYTPSSEFINELLTSMTKFSYRKENNIILLNWLNNIVNKKEIQYFWENCIKENNIPLFEQALNFPQFNEYLKNNYEQFYNDIKNIQKNHTVEQSFKKPLLTKEDIDYILNKNKPISFSNMTTDNFEEKKKTKKTQQANTTTIITKKIKKII